MTGKGMYFTKEFKPEAVRSLREFKRPSSELAIELGIRCSQFRETGPNHGIQVA